MTPRRLDPIFRAYLSGERFLDDAERRHAIAVQKACVQRIVGRFLASRTPLERCPARAAILYLHESIHVAGLSGEATRCQIGTMALGASPTTQRSILLAVLKALAEAPLEAPSWQWNVICGLRFVHDYRWGLLIKAILRQRLMRDEEFVRALLERLSHLTDRIDSYFPASSYVFPFASVIRFVNKHMASCSIERLTPDIEALLRSLGRAVKNDLIQWKKYSEEEAQTLSAHPEKWFTKADRTAIELIQSWVQK